MNTRSALALSFGAFLQLMLCPLGVLDASPQAGTAPLIVNDSPLRTWSSPDGKFKRQGKLTGISGDQIQLELADGKSITAQAAKLSKPDQEFIDSERERVQAAGGDSLEENGWGISADPAEFQAELDLSIDPGDVRLISLGNKPLAGFDQIGRAHV